VAIVVCFLLLVTPSELLHLCYYTLSPEPPHLYNVTNEVQVNELQLLHLCYYVVRHDNAPVFELALVVANVLQTANFALIHTSMTHYR